MTRTRWRWCMGCGVEYSVLEHNGIAIGMEREDDGTGCPRCNNEEFLPVASIGTGIELGGEAGVGRHYPYFDRGLGQPISSAAHRRRVMKKHNLTAVEGDFDLERMISQDQDERNAVKDRVKAQQDRYEHAPEFRDFRRMRDVGALRDIATKQADRVSQGE